MDDREQALAHLRLICAHPGFWELRSLQRLDGNNMSSRGSFFIIAIGAADGLIYDRLEQAVEWADYQARNGSEIFLGMNPRVSEAGTKAAVQYVSALFVDLDLAEGETQESALEVIREMEPAPSLVVDSGFGLHVSWLLSTPSPDKSTWTSVQKRLTARLTDMGADRLVSGDESRVLRLVPYKNRKRWPTGVATSILLQSDARYTLEELADIAGTGTAFSPRELLTGVPDPRPTDPVEDDNATPPLDAVEMKRLVARAEGSRAVLEAWIKRALKPGLHFGIIPIAGNDSPKPTLLKPGAELIALLYGWRFHFGADLDSLQMYNDGGGGIFAYICTVIGSDGRTVGQGRGMAELREPGMQNPNKTVKMALKRAQVDAVLRCAGLSQYFTQDLDEPQYIAPAALQVAPNGNGKGTDRATPAECQDIRIWLKMVGKSEAEITAFYKIGQLEELPSVEANKVIRRLMELRRGQPPAS